jgi:hypothetical protein
MEEETRGDRESDKGENRRTAYFLCPFTPPRTLRVAGWRRVVGFNEHPLIRDVEIQRGWGREAEGRFLDKNR